VQTSILSNILPGHASVTDAVTRLQRERDLALRRVDEFHEHYKKENQKKDEADRKATLIGMEVRNSQIRDAQKETEHYKKQFENAMSLGETKKLSIKLTSLAKSQNSMPKRPHKCVAFAVNARLGSTIMRIE
jgi:hypothetical protein